MTIKKRLFIGFLSLIFLAVAGSLLNIHSLEGIKEKALVTQKTSAPLALDAADMKLCVVQVQQWLTDISATRGAEGFDDGFAEAENYAVRFREVLGKFRKTYQDKGDQAGLTKVAAIEKDFEEYYRVGKQMANAYIQFGPEQGNVMMGKFDPFAAKLSEHVGKFVKEQMSSLHLSQEAIVGDSRSSINIAIAILILSVVVGMGVAVVLGRSVSDRIKNVVSSIVDAEKNSDLRNEISVDSKDEIFDMAESFNNFSKKMRHIVQDLSEKSSLLASTSAEISATSEETAAGSVEQARQCDSVSAATEEMTATAAEMAQNAHHASELTKTTNETAESGEKIMHEAIEGINKISKWVSQSSDTMVQLGESSEKIGQVISVIDDIADQTNLLALNAAIEAARAGEQGRGFAVVADEVRKLAERTQHATKEIAETIESIQTETNLAVNAMGEGTKEVNKGVEKAYQAEGALKEIAGKIKETSDEVDRLATAIEQQSAASSEISLSVENINNSAKEFSSGSQQSAQAAADLDRLAEEMNQLVKQFKI